MNILFFYISDKSNSKLEETLKNRGFKNITQVSPVEKQTPKEWRQANLISIRVFDDLMGDKREDSGIDDPNEIIRILTHKKIWDMNFSENTKIIVLDTFDNNVKLQDNFIPSSISNQKGLIIGSPDLYFYISDPDTLKTLLQNLLPINVDLPKYVSYQKVPKQIEPYAKTVQPFFPKWIRRPCFVCMLPRSIYFYIVFGLVIIGIFVTIFIMRKKVKECESSSFSK